MTWVKTKEGKYINLDMTEHISVERVIDQDTGIKGTVLVFETGSCTIVEVYDEDIRVMEIAVEEMLAMTRARLALIYFENVLDLARRIRKSEKATKAEKQESQNSK